MEEGGSEEESRIKFLYNEKLRDFYAKQSKTEHNVKKAWSADRISQVIQQIKDSRVTMQRKSKDYYWLSKYDIMEAGDEEILIFKKKCIDNPTIRIVPMEKYFEILTDVHKSVGHGGRLKMIHYIKNRLYIPKKAIEIFVELCSVCEIKRSVPKKGIVTKPIISKNFNVRGHVDLMDLQSTPDGEYIWLMNYQDHATKFLHLRPLKTKTAAEVATELLKIFLEFGAPCILQSDNGKEFTAHVIEELVMIWPECKIINGGPRHIQTQGSVERSKQDVKNMLQCWMQDNTSTKWSLGCYFVQYYKNSYHRLIGRSPYRALFGSDPKTILKGCNIPQSVIASIQTEEEFDKITQKETCIADNNERINLIPLENKTVNVFVADTVSAPFEDVPIINFVDCNVEILKIENKKSASSHEQLMCLVCGKETSGAHTCSLCTKPVHDFCSISNGQEGCGSRVLCLLCKNEQVVINEREQALRGVKRSAEKMVDGTVKKLPLLGIGYSVFLNVPKIDRGPLNTKHIAGKVVDYRNGVYKIGTMSGTIKNWFARQDLQMSSNEYKEVISELPISLRQAVTCQSMFGGHGFHKCSCKPAKNQCQTNRCACLKNKSLCTSKCHESLSCTNK